MAKKRDISPIEKVRLETRLDADIVDGLRWLSDEAGVSINQVVNGIMRWAVNNGHSGDPAISGKHVVGSEDQPGCLWFGRLLDEDDPEGDPGMVAFSLDFTERRVVREDW